MRVVLISFVSLAAGCGAKCDEGLRIVDGVCVSDDAADTGRSADADTDAEADADADADESEPSEDTPSVGVGLLWVYDWEDKVIFTHDLDTRVDVVQATGVDPDCRYFHLSPDGERLACTTASMSGDVNEFYIYNLASGALTTIPVGNDIAGSDSDHKWAVSWLNDETVVFTIQDYMDFERAMSLYRINVDGGARQYFGTFPWDEHYYIAVDTTGSQVAFHLDSNESNVGDFLVAGSASTGPEILLNVREPLTYGVEAGPVFAGDHLFIVGREHSGGDLQIYSLVPPSNSLSHRLDLGSDAPFYSSPPITLHGAPDGSTIVMQQSDRDFILWDVDESHLGDNIDFPGRRGVVLAWR